MRGTRKPRLTYNATREHFYQKRTTKLRDTPSVDTEVEGILAEQHIDDLVSYLPADYKRGLVEFRRCV